jgi:mRNA interferase HigB
MEQPLFTVTGWLRPQSPHLFGTAVDVIGDNRLVFDIAGNKFRLIVHVAYPFRRMLIKFVGTHAEYDRVDAEKVGR